jgi:hypothetical protein
VAELVRAWREAERRGTGGDPEACARGLLQIAGEQAGSLLEPIAVLAAAQWLHQAGRYEGAAGARQFFDDVARAEGPVRDHAEVGLDELAFSEGHYDAALAGFSRVVSRCADLRLRDWAAFRRARCLEVTGHWQEAVAGYKAVEGSKCAEIADEAAFAARKPHSVATGAAPPHPMPGGAIAKGGSKAGSARGDAVSVRYLGEDRATQGDWYTYYGSEAFVLCAQQAPDNISGGEGLTVTPSTGNPKEPAKKWVSTGTDDHPATLYNPVSRVRRPANWDDRGEAYPRGQGPDLWLDVSVPAGEHRLSLYFVNDHCYYEPDRVYTVSVYDDAGRHQAGTEVRWFVNGVYKQFAVAGPAKLRVLIARDLSMNVLLSGVFLDSLQPKATQPPAAGSDVAWASWQTERERHLSPPDERAAFRAAVRSCRARGGSEPASFLDAFTAAELKARRYGPAMWAVEEREQMLTGQPDARFKYLKGAVDMFRQMTVVRAPMPAPTVVPWPMMKSVFEDYLQAATAVLHGDQLAEFYRKTSQQYQNYRLPLAGIADERLVALVGNAGLTADDQYRLTFGAKDTMADTRRLETLIHSKADLPNRAKLQLLLLGRYLAAKDDAKAESLVADMRAGDPKADTTANAVYLLAVHYYNAKQPERARPLLEEVMKGFPGSHWAKYAGKYADRITSAAPKK